VADILTLWDPETLSADWRVAGPDGAALGPGGTGEGGALAEDAELVSAVLLSLFTDARARDDDRLPDAPEDGPAPGTPGDRRGWWADAEAPEGALGSRLWLLSREKATERTRRRAEQYAEEALAWMVEDGLVEAVRVEADWTAPERLDLAVTLALPGGRPVRRTWAWYTGETIGAFRQPDLF